LLFVWSNQTRKLRLIRHDVPVAWAGLIAPLQAHCMHMKLHEITF